MSDDEDDEEDEDDPNSNYNFTSYKNLTQKNPELNTPAKTSQNFNTTQNNMSQK